MLPTTDNISEYRGDTARELRYVARGVKVNTVAGDATLTVDTTHVGPGFVESDEGLTITGEGILDGTTILTYTSPTSVELSTAANATGTTVAGVRSYDLTGCTPTAQIRVAATDDTVLYTFACELTDQEDDLGGIVMEIEAGVTDDAPDAAVWDWQLAFADGSVRTFGAGKVKFKGQVTR